jgi:hypothetical protein
VLGSFVLNLFLNGIIIHILDMVNTLQIILHLPMMTLVFPGNVMAIFRIILPIAQFDVLQNFGVLELIFWKSKQDALEYRDEIQNVSILGYDSFNLVLNIGSMFLGFIWWTTIFFLFVLVILPLKHLKFKFFKKKYKNMVNRVFFGDLILISMGSFFEICLSCYLCTFGPE